MDGGESDEVVVHAEGDGGAKCTAEGVMSTLGPLCKS